MPSELTAGFDVTSQISQKTVEKIFGAYFGSGGITNYVRQPYQSPQGPSEMEIFIGPPKLRFIEQVNLINPVSITFPFLLRLSHENDEYGGNATVVASTSMESVIVGAEEAVVITVDFSGLGDHLFEFELGGYSLSISAPEAFPPEFETEIKPVIIAALKAVSSELQISPALIYGDGFFTAGTYVLPQEASFLGIFVNNADVERAAPQSYQRFPYDDGVAVPADAVYSSIHQNLQNMGLDPASLPSPLPNDPDYTVYSLSIVLRNGYLAVSGDVDDVEFSARLRLQATANGIETVVLGVDFDLPWYLDILDAFGGAITRAMEEELPKALSGLSQALAGIDLFADGLPNPSVPGNPVTIHVEVLGGVTILETGLILQLKVNPEFDPAPVKEPVYIKGNKYTREFHRKKCPYGKKLKWQNTNYLLNEASAIRQGYNGCWTCAREYSHPGGRVTFGFQSLGHSPGELIERTIEVTGKLAEPMVIDGVEVTDPPFQVKESVSHNANEAGVWTIKTGLGSYPVQPGLWRFTAISGTWTGECEFLVKPTAQNFGAKNYVSYTFGNPNGNYGYGELPPFP